MSGQPSQYKENLGNSLWHIKLNAGLDALWDADVAFTSTIADLSSLINNWAIEDQIVTMIPVTCTYSDNNTFTLPGDYTSRFPAGAVVQIQVAAGMVFSTVASSSYAAPNTTVNLNDTVLTNPITRVYVVATRDGLWPNGPGYVVARDYGTGRTDLEDADALAASAGKELLITYSFPIDDDVTLSAPKVSIQPGAPLPISTTKTLTINGLLTSGPYQVFNCTGTGAVKFDDTSPQVYFYPEWFGAVGNGGATDGTGTDDIAALNACRDAMTYNVGGHQVGRGIMMLSRWYGVSSTFSLVDITYANNRSFGIYGSGKQNSGLVGLAACDNKPVMEIVGTPMVDCHNFGIAGITTGTTEGYAGAVAPSVGLLLARSDTGINAYNSRFIDLGFWGYFRFGEIYNAGYSDSEFRNILTDASPINTDEWMFDICVVNQALHATNPFQGVIVSTNGTISINTAYAGENCKMVNCYFNNWNNETYKKAGNAGLYQHGQRVYNEKCMFGGLMDYQIYSHMADVYSKDTWGDGYGQIAGVYLYSPTLINITVDLDNVTNKVLGSVSLKTHANVVLRDSHIKRIRGLNGFSIDIAGGAHDCHFTNLETMTSFKMTSGYWYNNELEIPLLCGEVLITPNSYNRNNIIKDMRLSASETQIGGSTGSVRIGTPTATPKLYVGEFSISWLAAIPTTGSWSRGDVIFSTVATTGAPAGWSCILDNTFGTLTANTGSITNGSNTLTVANLTNMGAATGLKIGDWIDVVGGTVEVTNSPRRVININSTTKEVALDAVVTTTGSAPVVDEAVTFHNHTTGDAFKAWANLP